MMSSGSSDAPNQPVYHIPLPPYSATYEPYPEQANVQFSAPINSVPIPNEPPPPYEACFPPIPSSSPPPPYTASSSPGLTPAPKGQQTIPSDGASTSEHEPETPQNIAEPRTESITDVGLSRELVLTKVVLKLRYYQFVLGFALAAVGVVGLDLHYFGSQYAFGLISGIFAMVAIAWTDPRKRYWLLKKSEWFHYSLFTAVNGLAFLAPLVYVVFHSYGLYISSHKTHKRNVDNTSEIVNQAVGVGIASVLMLIIASKWMMTKSLTVHSVVPSPPPQINLPPLPKDVINLNICIVFFGCVTMFCVGAFGLPWRYYGYKLGIPFICSGVAFLTVIYCGDPRSNEQGKERVAKNLFKIIHVVIIVLAVYYIVLHSYGISVDLGLRTGCDWNNTTANDTKPACHLRDKLSEAPVNYQEINHRVLVQALGIFFAGVIILTHVLKWKILKVDYKML